jgi:8-oxo-dGTP pyrophosphatase MutT (NUDIX family)
MTATFPVQGDSTVASTLGSAAQLANRLSNIPPQVAAVCYRRKAGVIEFLLVNTSGGKWTFPKGGVGAAASPHKAALQEAWEEAGAFGEIEKRSFTSYLHDRGEESVLIVAFLLNVQHTVDPLESYRNPRWFSPERAKKKLGELRTTRYRKEFERVIDDALMQLG